MGSIEGGGCFPVSVRRMVQVCDGETAMAEFFGGMFCESHRLAQLDSF